MPLFGAHLSIAGGYHKALLAARELGCDTVQLFTKQPNQWAAKPISDEAAETFRQVLQETGLRYPMAHDSYLINLASPDETAYRRSIEAFVEEVNRAEKLGLAYLVSHPGAHLADTPEAGLARVAAALDEVHQRTPGYRVKVLLETTAGQGTYLGGRFEHLAHILELVKEPDRLGVCLDTCHVFAAGYSLASEADYQATMKAFDELIGLDRLLAFHLNDSAKELGSHVDRHAHIGEGKIGLDAFRFLVNDRRFRHHPMILELPPAKVDADLATLRALTAAAAA